MANRSSVLRGNQIQLGITFYDACQNLADPIPLSSVSVSIYPPGHDPRLDDEDANAWVLDATLTSGGSGPEADANVTVQHVSTGKFTYTFTVPTDADIGPAFDRWQATVDTEDLDETFTFVIVGGGSVGSSQLYDNNMVFIRLHDTIADTDGNTLGADYEWYFTTTYNPLYTSARRIRLDLGALIRDISDDTINLAIFEASIEADALSFGSIQTRTASVLRFFEFARRQYVTCVAELILLNAINGGSATDGGKSKRLSDLDVSYNGDSKFDDLLERAISCRLKWEATLTSAGEIGPGTSQKPSMVIKGSLDPDRPDFGRDWEATSTHSGIGSEYPAANIRSRKSLLYRRYKRTFRTSRWGSRFSGRDVD